MKLPVSFTLPAHISLVLSKTLSTIGGMIAMLTVLGLMAAHEHTADNSITAMLLKFTSTEELPDVVLTYIRIISAAGLLILGFHWMDREEVKRETKRNLLADKAKYSNAA